MNKKLDKVKDLQDKIRKCISDGRHYYCNVCGVVAMAKERKKETIIFEGLGFPIRLINVPMKKVFGEWFIDIDFNKLQEEALYALANKPTPLNGGEIRFIIDYLGMSTRKFAKEFGVSHSCVLKWEKEQSRMTPSTEIYIRLYILNFLKADPKELKKLFEQFKIKELANMKHKHVPLDIAC